MLNIIFNMCSLMVLTSMKCFIAPYMGSSLQPNGLIELPQAWGYIFSPMESSLNGKRKGRKALSFVLHIVHFFLQFISLFSQLFSKFGIIYFIVYDLSANKLLSGRTSSHELFWGILLFKLKNQSVKGKIVFPVL